ncbi:MAG: serine hydrolase domain-containing protein [Pseudomonadota bacterium]
MRAEIDGAGQMHGPSVASVDRRQMLGWTAGGAALAGLSSPAFALWQAAERYPALRAYIGDYVSTRRLPGAIAAIGFGDAALDSVAAGTIAFDSTRAVDSDTLWRLYSMTKPITGMAAMLLIDEGKLRLDQPISDILPAFARMQVLTSADAPIDQTVAAEHAITIRHLLTHTAGLGYTIIQRGPIKAAYEAAGIVPAQVSRLSIPGISNAVPAPSLEAFADRLATLPLVYQPGARWSYSISLDLLGRIIEVVSGQPFDAFLKARIFDPLGMVSTSFRVSEGQADRLSSNYAPFGGALIPIDPATTSIYRDAPAFPFGGAGLVSSARDYDRFLNMLANHGELGGERILSSEAAHIAMSNLLPANIGTEGTLASGDGFGAGGRVTRADSPNGGGIYGWGGAAGTIAFVDPNRKIRFGGFANYMPAESYDFQRHVAEVFLEDMTQR